ncbi:MAG: DUF4365 domain-containing protein [Richelia sp. RM2_1_2]|nr:DUF4365 domain-containing protein [Richelia sp. SM2_1_7]NJM20655.1 DUF4365 domain-containing protein [Richelia sp. SM1_7_0]NJN12812.1 DUF4365 domain-containing protein [Richelia sp. RM1_1_1]NJO27288.1 DUF4365 domain-containing protein [Richelia sp. SL_2_1]NJO63455.1 DUF4365 domain-containing protein [Richelia sp. RM2_1_2]
MDINIQKEEFSYAYIYAVVSAAGYSCQIASRPMDIGGIDIIISGEEKEFTLYPPRLEVQVKSTSTAVIDNEFVRYPLKLKNYNELRKSKTLVPKILVVVLLPDNPEEWVNQSEEELCLRRCGYWLSLKGQPETQNRESVTVYLPCQQLFTVSAVKNIMDTIETRGRL